MNSNVSRNVIRIVAGRKWRLVIHLSKNSSLSRILFFVLVLSFFSRGCKLVNIVTLRTNTNQDPILTF